MNSVAIKGVRNYLQLLPVHRVLVCISFNYFVSVVRILMFYVTFVFAFYFPRKLGNFDKISLEKCSDQTFRGRSRLMKRASHYGFHSHTTVELLVITSHISSKMDFMHNLSLSILGEIYLYIWISY